MLHNMQLLFAVSLFIFVNKILLYNNYITIFNAEVTQLYANKCVIPLCSLIAYFYKNLEFRGLTDIKHNKTSFKLKVKSDLLNKLK